MVEITDAHEEFLVKAGKWIKAHAQQYCPITAVKHIPVYRQIFKDLRKLGLVSAYKSGNVIIIEKAGWGYLAGVHPEVMWRYRKSKK